MPQDLINRYHVDLHESRYGPSAAANWIYRMISTTAPLEEKIALFWHGIFGHRLHEDPTRPARC